MRLANDTQRHAIYGQAGSGKTVAGLWALERRSFDKRPWFILDYKGDPTIKRIPRLERVDPLHAPTKHPGLYVMRPFPGDNIDAWLWQVWDRGKTGLFVDEGYMLGRFNKPFNAILTQGRSKRIPVIALSQRPSWLSPFLMSEADFHQVMHVQNPDDFKKLQQWIPGVQPTRRNFHSQYYDVATGELEYLKPVPDEEEILDRFDRKVPRRIHHFRGLLVNAGQSRGTKRRAF